MQPLDIKSITKMRRTVKIKRPYCGFTMIELLVVLLILGLLAALVGPVLYKSIEPAKRTTAAAQVENFMTAMDAYYIDNGKFQSSDEGLKALREKPPSQYHLRGLYLKKEIPYYSWVRSYIYRSPGRCGVFDILSYGEDGK